MPATPGHAALPYVAEETDIITSILNQLMKSKTLTQPTASEVLKELSNHDVVHFACHGISDRKNPSRSRLVLLDSSKPGSPAIDPLTVQAISDAYIERAQLAYLSACSTADNTATGLGDETLHLASAFQLAGFTHVVANLWPSKDKACMQVAGDFYRALFSSGVVGGVKNMQELVWCYTERWQG